MALDAGSPGTVHNGLARGALMQARSRSPLVGAGSGVEPPFEVEPRAAPEDTVEKAVPHAVGPALEALTYEMRDI